MSINKDAFADPTVDGPLGLDRECYEFTKRMLISLANSPELKKDDIALIQCKQNISNQQQHNLSCLLKTWCTAEYGRLGQCWKIAKDQMEWPFDGTFSARTYMLC